MRLLVISDSHVPERARWIPDPIQQFLLKEYFDMVVHAGDIVDEELLNFLRRSTDSEVLAVRGNMDYLELPRYLRIPLENITVGVIHGNGIYPRGDPVALTKVARKLGVNILISGHTHSPFVIYDKTGILHVNPGSVTGVRGGAGGSGIPSLATLRVESREVEVAVYELVGKALVEKRTYRYAF